MGLEMGLDLGWKNGLVMWASYVGNGVILRERFIIANISCPLLALGHIVPAGWEIQHFSDEVLFVKNGKFVNVSFKRSSLCVEGSIRMISKTIVCVLLQQLQDQRP